MSINFLDDDGEWHSAAVQVPDWKDAIRPIIQRMVDRTPGAIMEAKDFSLAWHYRNSEPELATIRTAEYSIDGVESARQLLNLLRESRLNPSLA